MASTCAIMAVCWKEHAGYKYLRENDAAFCIDAYDKILPQLQQIVENPRLISEYASKAHQCGLTNHNKEKYKVKSFLNLSKLYHNPDEGSSCIYIGYNS